MFLVRYTWNADCVLLLFIIEQAQKQCRSNQLTKEKYHAQVTTHKKSERRVSVFDVKHLCYESFVLSEI